MRGLWFPAGELESLKSGDQAHPLAEAISFRVLPVRVGRELMPGSAEGLLPGGKCGGSREKAFGERHSLRGSCF